MLYTRNAYHFRKFYKEEVARESGSIDLKFVGSLHPDKNRRETGFAKLIYGNREDLGKLLGTIALNVAADDQAIYELIQNADDCSSSFFSVSYNEEYLLCINNGNYFTERDMSAIINVAGNYKDGEDIGTFGIGFKILHRLVGADDGREAIINDYAGPIIFSWNKFFQLDSFLNGEEIKVGFDLKKDSENPWLVKLLYTCFPSHLEEKIKLQGYDTEGVKFSTIELSEMRAFLKESLQNVNLKETNNLKNGSIFFLKLGVGKNKFLDEGIDKIKSGLSYSFKFLNSLRKIYINGEEIKPQTVLDYSNSISINSEAFIDINPKNKNRDIKFTFAFFRDYREAFALQSELAPNLYTFFSMDEEKNGFSFLLHCNAFDMNNDRRKLQANSQINDKLLPIIAQSILHFSDNQKVENRNLFLSLYASFLLSKEPKSKPHINNNFSKYFQQYISQNIPTKNGFSGDSQKVKINKIKLQLNLADFGLNDIQWFEWDNEADSLLIEEATKPEKLGIEEWDIRDIVEKAELKSINQWIASCDEKTYRTFISEIEKNSYLRDETKKKLFDIKLFKFSDNEFYSVNDLWITSNVREFYQEKTFNLIRRDYDIVHKSRIIQKTELNKKIIFCTDKTIGISSELQKLGFIVSLENVKTFEKIYSAIVDKLPREKDIYYLIAEKCKTNTLDPIEKKKLFLNFINESTKFDNVGEGTLKDLQLFCNSNLEIEPLSKLIGNIRVPVWLIKYKINQVEFFQELNTYLILESEDIFKEIYRSNQEDIISELTSSEEIKSLIQLYQDNQESFFKEFIIKKGGSDFLIHKKTNKSYQVQSADKEARMFLDKHCPENLFVLPSEFSEKFKDEEGIIKADYLHSLILEFVDVNEHKDILVDILRYNAKHKFLQELSEFRFNLETEYTQDDYQFKILDLACSELIEGDFQKFRNKVVIETENQDLNLSEIPPFVERIKIHDYELSLAKILPGNYKNSDHLGTLINQFIQLGLNKDRIFRLFGVGEEPEPSNIFRLFSDQVRTLENGEQLAFLFLYGLHIEKINFSFFKALNVNGDEVDLGWDKYLADFDFIQQSETLHQKYRTVTTILNNFPFVVERNNNLMLLQEPFFENDQFICPYIIEDLTDTQRVSFFEYLFKKWNINSKKHLFKNIDWSIIDLTSTQKFLGFNPNTSVYPSNYACSSEVLPDYLIDWTGTDEAKIEFLADLGVWTKNSVVIELRKALSDSATSFHNTRMAQETRFNQDETNLFNSFVWLIENEIKLKTATQFQTFNKIVEVINGRRTTHGDLIIKEDYDFEELKKTAVEWEESYYENWKQDSDFSIFLYEGELPKRILLDEIDDYVFYAFNEGNIAFDGTNNIFINLYSDVKKELRKLELEEGNNFDFDGLWQSKLEKLEKENAQLRKTNEATLGGQFDTDISKNDQKEANREAKEIVREKLEAEGFWFKNGIGNFSTINAVYKDDVEYPLVVKSYKYQDEPLKIGANEWIQLMKPNSMFWLHFGDRKLGCLKLYELLRKQDKLTISFSTENLDLEDRLDKFAELLHYFGNVHFNFDTVKPSDYSVADDLSDYRFDERRDEEDLSGDNEDLLK